MARPMIFISHTGTDDQWLDRFVESLKSRDLAVWTDTSDIPAGTSFVNQLKNALRSSDLIVSLIDEKAVSNPNLFVELGVALALSKRMIGIVPPDFDLELLPAPLRERSFLIKQTPAKTAELVASLAESPSGGSDELSDVELLRMAQHIKNYLKANSFTKVSFERIRERINPNYTDQLLLDLIEQLPGLFRRVRLKKGSGLGFVDSWFVSSQLHEYEYFKKKIKEAFPHKSDDAIHDAILSCRKAIAPSEGRQKLTECVHKKLS